MSGPSEDLGFESQRNGNSCQSIADVDCENGKLEEKIVVEVGNPQHLDELKQDYDFATASSEVCKQEYSANNNKSLARNNEVLTAELYGIGSYSSDLKCNPSLNPPEVRASSTDEVDGSDGLQDVVKEDPNDNGKGTNPRVLMKRLTVKQLNDVEAKQRSPEKDTTNAVINRRMNVTSNSSEVDLEFTDVKPRKRGRPRKKNYPDDPTTVLTATVKNEKEPVPEPLPFSPPPSPPKSESLENSNDSTEPPQSVEPEPTIKSETEVPAEEKPNQPRYSIREKRARVCYAELFPCGRCTHEFSSEEELKIHEKWCRKFKYEDDSMNTYELAISQALYNSSDTGSSFERSTKGAKAQKSKKSAQRNVTKPTNKIRDAKPNSSKANRTLVLPTKKLKKPKKVTSKRILKKLSCDKYLPEDLTTCNSCSTQIPIAFLVAHLKLCWSTNIDSEETESSEDEEIPPAPSPPSPPSVDLPVVRKNGKTRMDGTGINPFQWKHKCDMCDKFFWLRPHLTKHLATEHAIIEPKRVKREMKRRHKRRVEEKQNITSQPVSTTETIANIRKRKKHALFGFQCEYCDKAFKTKIRLEIHGRKHPEQNQFVCTLCDKGFRNIDEADLHAKVHNGERPFPCLVADCSEKFTCLEYLEAHQRVEHPVELKSTKTKIGSAISKNKSGRKKKFSCPMCDKSFLQGQALTQHMRSHSDERPHQCPYEGCTAAYKGRQKFREHLRLHTGETPYECEVCGKAYARQFSFRMHVRRHQGFYDRFKCDSCGRKFTSNWAFNKHFPCS